MIKVGTQIADAFNPDRIANQVLRYAGASTFRRGKLNVARHRWWSGSGGHSSKVRSPLNKLETVEDATNLRKAPVRRKCENAAKARHLSACDCVTRMIPQPWIENFVDFRVAPQMLGNRHRVGIAALHSKRQGLQPAENRVGGFRMQNPAGYLSIVEYFLYEIAAPGNNAPEHVRVARQKLRGAVDDKIAAKFRSAAD